VNLAVTAEVLDALAGDLDEAAHSAGLDRFVTPPEQFIAV